MRNIITWTFLLVMAALVGFSGMLLATQSSNLARLLSQAVQAQESGSEMRLAQTGAPATANEQTPIAHLSTGELLNAVGTIEVPQARPAVLLTSGQVHEIAVEVGDAVQAGDLLVALDTTQLEWALEQAEIGFETARINDEALGETVSESDVKVAEANLLLAQENLALAQTGPTDEEVAAAQAAVQAAWAHYEELQQQPTQAQINQALANLSLAEIDVRAAQREYDKSAWMPEAAATEAADALHRATVALEAAQAAYDEASQPTSESELQTALSSAQSAQATLNELNGRPTAAEIADAEAKLAAAEAKYEQALLGPEESELRIAELAVREAMIGLEQARLDLDNARLVAPTAGTVLSVDVALGQQVAAGSIAVTLADPLDLQLVVQVEEHDISLVTPGQGVEISVYAHPDVIFLGVVDRIAPSADDDADSVTFPVVIELIDGPIERLRPGMTASASFLPDPLPTGEPSESAGENLTGDDETEIIQAPEVTPEQPEEAPQEDGGEEDGVPDSDEETDAESGVEAEVSGRLESWMPTGVISANCPSAFRLSILNVSST